MTRSLHALRAGNVEQDFHIDAAREKRTLAARLQPATRDCQYEGASWGLRLRQRCCIGFIWPPLDIDLDDHLEALRIRFEKFAKNVVVLRGGMGSRERRAAEEVLRVPEPEERLVLSTGRFLGEGFDDSRLDTLLLVSPISWKGTPAQYVGDCIGSMKARQRCGCTTT